MSFRLVPKSVTLNGVMALILRYFTKLGSILGALCKIGEDIYVNILRQKDRPKHLVFSNISFMMI